MRPRKRKAGDQKRELRKLLPDAEVFQSSVLAKLEHPSPATKQQLDYANVRQRFVGEEHGAL